MTKASRSGRPLTIVGLGEALFDRLPSGAVLGGAPVNFAVHASQLLAPGGSRVAVVSRVGKDPLGARLLLELNARGIDTGAVQTDPDHPTGTVEVDRTPAGQPIYMIPANSAWDCLDWTNELEQLASTCDAVCFGTLAQRSPSSRSSIQRFVAQAADAIRLFDLNLRQSFYSAEAIGTSLQLATIAKLNTDELVVIARLLGLGPTGTNGLDAIRALIERFALDGVCLTRGELGTLFVTRDAVHDGTPVSHEPEPHADAVGAGDACAAGLTCGLLRELSPDDCVALANRLGAWVASRRGATPKLPNPILDTFALHRRSPKAARQPAQDGA